MECLLHSQGPLYPLQYQDLKPCCCFANQFGNKMVATRTCCLQHESIYSFEHITSNTQGAAKPMHLDLRCSLLGDLGRALVGTVSSCVWLQDTRSRRDMALPIFVHARLACRDMTKIYGSDSGLAAMTRACRRKDMHMVPQQLGYSQTSIWFVQSASASGHWFSLFTTLT